MTLIKCPECGRQISFDPAKSFFLGDNEADPQKKIKCIICGNEYSFSDLCCPECKHPAMMLSCEKDLREIIKAYRVKAKLSMFQFSDGSKAHYLGLLLEELIKEGQLSLDAAIAVIISLKDTLEQQNVMCHLFLELVEEGSLTSEEAISRIESLSAEDSAKASHLGRLLKEFVRKEIITPERAINTIESQRMKDSIRMACLSILLRSLIEEGYIRPEKAIETVEAQIVEDYYKEMNLRLLLEESVKGGYMSPDAALEKLKTFNSDNGKFIRLFLSNMITDGFITVNKAVETIESLPIVSESKLNNMSELLMGLVRNDNIAAEEAIAIMTSVKGADRPKATCIRCFLESLVNNGFITSEKAIDAIKSLTVSEFYKTINIQRMLNNFEK